MKNVKLSVSQTELDHLAFALETDAEMSDQMVNEKKALLVRIRTVSDSLKKEKPPRKPRAKKTKVLGTPLFDKKEDAAS
jgi:hypothetical protein